MEPVVAGVGRQAQVGDHEPLGRGAVLVGGGVAWADGQGIDAGLEVRHQGPDGDGGGGLAVQLRLDVDLAAPDRLAATVLDLFGLPAIELREQGPVGLGLGQGPVADAVDLCLQGVGVDADHRDARFAPLGQDVGAPQKTRHGGTVAHIDVQVGGPEQGLAVRRGQAGADLDVVAPAMDHAVDADLLLLGLDGDAWCICDPHEVRQVRAVAGQGVGELDADARAGGVRVHLMAADPEAMLRHQGVVAGAQVAVVVQGQGRSGGTDGGPPGRPVGQGPAQGSQGVGSLGSGLAAQIGIDGRAGGVPFGVLLGLPTLWAGCQHRIGQADPGRVHARLQAQGRGVGIDGAGRLAAGEQSRRLPRQGRCTLARSTLCRDTLAQGARLLQV